MTTKQTVSAAIAAIFAFIPGIQPACAELPFNSEQPWLGYFAVTEERAFQFLFGPDGGIVIRVLNKDGGLIDHPIILEFFATETLPDGSVRELTVKPDTYESSDPPTAKLKKTVFRCKLTDHATAQPTLEGTIEISKGTIFANARITDKGAFDKNPLRPVIRARFQSFYFAENDAKAQWDRKRVKEFERQISKDSVTLKHLDGKSVKLDCIGVTDPKSSEVNGVGSSSAEVRMSAYQGRKVEFLAAPIPRSRWVMAAHPLSMVASGSNGPPTLSRTRMVMPNSRSSSDRTFSHHIKTRKTTEPSTNSFHETFRQ
jgi:hypothetical protein